MADFDSVDVDTSDTGDVEDSSILDAETSDETATSSVTDDSSEEVEAGGKGPGPVPYKRFQEVNRRAQLASSELSQVKAQNAYLVQQFQQVQEYLMTLQNKGSRTENEEPKYEDPYETELAAVKAQQAELNEWRRSQLVEREETKIRGEWDTAKAKYPHADPDYVFLLLERNPKLSVEALAKASHEKIVGVRGTGGNPPARPKAKPINGSSQSNLVPRPKFKSFEEATAAWLKR